MRFKALVVRYSGYRGEGMQLKVLVVHYPGYGGKGCSAGRWYCVILVMEGYDTVSGAGSALPWLGGEGCSAGRW